MLNYDIHTGEKEIELLESEVRGVGIQKNPFPGLRPFGIDECHLFFGRDGQVDEVLMKLSQNRFVAVMGFSGSGKSSLMYCGLIPVLYGGFMTHAGPNWNVVVTRPGLAPLDNLAESILQSDTEYLELPEEDRLIRHTVTSSILRSGVKGLVDLVKNLKEESGENLLILVDQFEELFRFSSEETDQVGINESALYINMLLEAIKQEEVPIYLALTMRSEFIGECSKYPGLTEMINLSNYLVPLMTREQTRMAIEGPVAVGGGRISSRLVKRLLSDVGGQQDQLPVLQHALMRTWSYWLENKEEDEPLDVRHYNAIGKISEALSKHANEAYDELGDRQKQICEILFKTITEKSSDNIGIRRPTKLKNIAEIAGADEEEVKEVIEHFRNPERSLLLPAETIVLESDSIIELSHESLIRIWTRLKSWVEDEYESAQMYRRLSEAAAMYQVGRTGLWRPPDLQLALNWQKKQNPTRIWAQRYDEAFERAIVFLDTSRITYEAEQRNQEMMQQRLLKRAKNVALLLGIAAVVLIIFFIFAVIQKIEADKKAEDALMASKNEEIAKIAAQRQRDVANQQTKLANISLIRAKIQSQKALSNQFYARYQAQQATSALALAKMREQEAKTALEGEKLAKQEAITQYNIAEARKNDIERLLHLSAAQSMAVKSTNLPNKNLQGLLAQQAFVFNRKYDGNPYDPYIYDGLYEAMSSFEGEGYNEFKGHNDAVRSITFAPDQFIFYSAGSDGSVRKWDPRNPDNTLVLSETRTHPNRVVKISPDGSWMAVGSDSTDIQLFDLRTNTHIKDITGHKGFVYDIAFTNNSAGFYSLSFDRTIRYYDLKTNKSNVVKRLQTPLKTFALSPDEKFIVGGSGSMQGQLVYLDLKNLEERVLYEEEGNRIHAVAISPDGTYIAFGDEKGVAHIWDIAENKEVNTLRGHTARINDIEFSRDGNMLATGSYDGSVQLYVMDKLDELPIVMKDHDTYVWDLSFSRNGDFIVSATNSNIIKIWPTKFEYYADKICGNVSRNMTDQEWKRYIPDGIDYSITCLGYKSGNGDK